MKRPEIPFIVFGALFILTIPFSFDTATSVVPGWHTTVLTPSFLISIAGIAIPLLLVAIAYRWLSKRAGVISLPFFIVHLLLTIPIVLFIRAPHLLLTLEGTDLTIINRQVTFATALIAGSLGLFVIGQVLFGFYLIRTMRAGRHLV